MRASLVTSFDQPLEIRDVPIPEPRPDQVLVRVEASGLCHTDIHAARGDWPVKPSLPFIPGHEGVGIIEQVGTAVTGRSVGERVAVPKLEEINQAFDDVLAGRIPARLVFEF